MLDCPTVSKAALSRLGLELERELERSAARKLAAALGRQLEDVVPTLPSKEESRSGGRVWVRSGGGETRGAQNTFPAGS